MSPHDSFRSTSRLSSVTPLRGWSSWPRRSLNWVTPASTSTPKWCRWAKSTSKRNVSIYVFVLWSYFFTEAVNRLMAKRPKNQKCSFFIFIEMHLFVVLFSGIQEPCVPWFQKWSVQKPGLHWWVSAVRTFQPRFINNIISDQRLKFNLFSNRSLHQRYWHPGCQCCH